MLTMPLKPFADRAVRKRVGEISDRLFCVSVALAIVLFAASFPSPLFSAREDTARLLFQKTAPGDQTRVHVVRKGESIGTILRTQLRNNPASRALVRRLNPDIADLNRIFPGQKIVLRAGYSANADLIIREKKDVVTIPERLVTFEDGGKKAFVELPGKDPKAVPKKVEIKTGISDGLNIEVTSGVKKGDQLVQRPPKQIS